MRLITLCLISFQLDQTGVFKRLHCKNDIVFPPLQPANLWGGPKIKGWPSSCCHANQLFSPVKLIQLMLPSYWTLETRPSLASRLIRSRWRTIRKLCTMHRPMPHSLCAQAKNCNLAQTKLEASLYGLLCTSHNFV